MTLETLGRIILAIGLGLAVVGLVLVLLGRLNAGNNALMVGNLPGDIRIQRGGLTCLFPIVSMLLLSIGLTIILNFLIRMLNR